LRSTRIRDCRPEHGRAVTFRNDLSLDERRAEGEIGEDACEAAEDERHSGDAVVVRDEEVGEHHRHRRLRPLAEDLRHQLPAEAASDLVAEARGVEFLVFAQLGRHDPSCSTLSGSNSWTTCSSQVPAA